MDEYILASDSPVTRVTVNGKRLKVGDQPIDLTIAEAKSVEDLGAKLSKMVPPSGESNEV